MNVKDLPHRGWRARKACAAFSLRHVRAAYNTWSERMRGELENLNKLEGADIKRLEEEEAFRLKTHEAKKNLQRQKKAT